MKYKAPVICPVGSTVMVAQHFKPDIHESVDFILWDYSLDIDENRRLTFGAKLVAPFDYECIQSDFREETGGNDSKPGPYGGWVDIKGYFDETRDITFHFQHNCKNLVLVGDKGKEGDVVALMGNSGPVYPIPTADRPFDGGHCHLTVYLRGRNPGDNGIRVNPEDYIDFTQWYNGTDSSIAVDGELLKWWMKRLGITSVLEKLIYVWRIFKL